MVVSLKHKFASAKTDGADATLVRPSNWNDEHDITLAASKLLGRATASTGAAEEITVGTSLSLDAATQTLRRAALTGDVTASVDSNATTIATDAVTTAKILDANVTTAKIADLNVTTGKLAAGAATLAKLDTTGASGQVLTAQGSGVAPIWAAASGGSALALEYIGSGVQSGSTALAFTSIPSGYTTLYVAYTIHMNGSPDFYVNLSSNNGTSYGVNRLLNNASENDGVGSGFASISNVGTTGTSKVITPRFSYITGIANANQRAVGTYTTAATEATITGVINAIRFNNTSFANATTVVLYGVK